MMASRTFADDARIEQARGLDILDVAGRVGAKLKRVTRTEWAGPCPSCGGTDRFSINTAKRVFSCRSSADKGGDVIAMTQHALGLDFGAALEFLTGEARSAPARKPRPSPSPAIDAGNSDPRTADAMELWRSGVDPRGTAAETYLINRGLRLADDPAGCVLRWHADAGAMLALFRNIMTGEPQAVSRTYLDNQARKLGRKFLGPVGGGAVMLDDFADVTGGLHIGEGVETCIAARMLGLRPTWALGSKGAIGAFPVLAGIEALTIFAEPDAERESETCAARWNAAGCEVTINRTLVGKDLADVFKPGDVA